METTARLRISRVSAVATALLLVLVVFAYTLPATRAHGVTLGQTVSAHSTAVSTTIPTKLVQPPVVSTTTAPVPPTSVPPTAVSPTPTPPPPAQAPPPATAQPTTAPNGYGCAAALAYLAANANPEFTVSCPGYADGNEAMTCVNHAPECAGEHIIVIADPCPAAYMNEAYNSQSWSDALGEFTRPIDPYGGC